MTSFPGSARTRRRRPVDLSVAAVLAVVIACLFLTVGIPVGKLLGAALSPDGRSAILASLTIQTTPLRNTIVLGALVGTLGTAIGFLTAYAQVFLDFRGKRALHWITLLPTVSPPFATATALITLFGKRGIITFHLLGADHNIYGLQGLTIVLAITFAPVAYLNIRGMFENMDPSHFEAAASLGASPLQTLFKVTIPMTIPALLASFLVLFVEGIADLANPLVLGGDYRVLASQIYFAVAGGGDVASAAGIALVLLVPAISVFAVQKYWAGKKTVITVTGKPTGTVKPVTARTVKYPVLLLVGVWVALVLACYTAILVGGFVKILAVDNSWTLDHYQFVYRLGADAVTKTLMMTLIATPIAALLALLIAWLVVRHLPRAGRILDFVGMLGIAVPGTVLGLGFALAYSGPTWFLGHRILPPLAGGLATGAGAVSIIMVYIARAIPTGQQACISALKQINPQVEEASTSLGASQITTLRLITLPLLRSGVVTAMTYGITKSMTMITAIIFITTPQTKVMTAQILDEVDAGHFGNAFAYCTVLIVLVLIVLALASLAINQLNRSMRTAQS